MSSKKPNAPAEALRHHVSGAIARGEATAVTEVRYKFRYWKKVKYVAANKPAPPHFVRCGHCKRAWDDTRSTAWTPAPSGRCPFEYWHK